MKTPLPARPKFIVRLSRHTYAPELNEIQKCDSFGSILDRIRVPGCTTIAAALESYTANGGNDKAIIEALAPKTGVATT